MKPAQRSWLSLVTFCAVTGVFAALGFAVLLAGASLTLAAAEPAQGADASAISDAAAMQTSVLQSMEQPAAAQTAVKPQSTTQPVDDNGSTSSTTFAGMITDSRCGARHPMNSGKSSAECVRSCVRNGARYVLVDGERIYALDGNPARLEQLASERVNVVGMLEGDTIKVQAVTQE